VIDTKTRRCAKAEERTFGDEIDGGERKDHGEKGQGANKGRTVARL